MGDDKKPLKELGMYITVSLEFSEYFLQCYLRRHEPGAIKVHDVLTLQQFATKRINELTTDLHPGVY